MVHWGAEGGEELESPWSVDIGRGNVGGQFQRLNGQDVARLSRKVVSACYRQCTTCRSPEINVKYDIETVLPMWSGGWK